MILLAPSDQKFLIRKTGRKIAAHLWDGADTACRMWSTGGLKKKNYTVHADTQGHEVCVMCLNRRGP